LVQHGSSHKCLGIIRYLRMILILRLDIRQDWRRAPEPWRETKRSIRAN
jgi:hypothetical protein